MNIELDNFRASPEPICGVELFQAIRKTEAKKAARRRFLMAAEIQALKVLVMVFRILHAVIV